MATPKEEAEVSSQKDKPKPISLIQGKSIPDDTIEETGAFLETSDLAKFLRSAQFVAGACKLEMKRRKELSEGLLRHVFNADPEKVEEFLNQTPANKKRILDKTCFHEGYDSKKLNKFVCFRHWKSVSALQAAALCLDKFLVIQLLAHIVEDDKLRLEAKKQLEEIRNRIAKESKESKESKEQQEYLISTAKGDRKEVHEKAQDSSKGDSKEAHEKTQNTSADQLEYAAPIKEFLKAYSDYVTQYQLLSTQGKWEEINKFLDVVGSCYKRLPRYVLQEIFKVTCWADDAEFSLEPPRGELRYWNNDLLDLDDLGDGTMLGKSRRRLVPQLGGGAGYGCIACEGVCGSVAIGHLYELRLVDLGNIIDALATPESALALIASDKGRGLKHF